MPLEDWSYRVEQAVAAGDAKAEAVFQTVTVLWYKWANARETCRRARAVRSVFAFFVAPEETELAVSWRGGIVVGEWLEKLMTNEFVAREDAARPKAWLAWSSGKDSAWALHTVRLAAEFEVVALLTTVNRTHGRVAMHAVRESLLEMQTAAAGLPLVKVPIPSPCSNEIYESAMSKAMARASDEGVRHVIFGDLFLEDIRAYREKQLARCEMTPLFPLWKKDTRALAQNMIAGGLRAYLTCVDPRQLDRGFAGRRFDTELLAELPAQVDPCGENGEFHTFACAGPMFRAEVPVTVGEIVERDGFVFADLLPRNAAARTA
jgi:uncharacterized protein (TIGR00290 family)